MFMGNENLTSFVGGDTGRWEVLSTHFLKGIPLEKVSKLDVLDRGAQKSDAAWILKGVSSNMRYTTKEEIDSLRQQQPALGRKEANYAAFIPIKKSLEWWELAQDERRKILEEQSAHVKTGIKYLPAIARKLYHCRDLGEPFDFITWFEFAPEDENKFNDLLVLLRKSEEWNFVTGEIDVRLKRLF
jgi:chlorite dismutase